MQRERPGCALGITGDNPPAFTLGLDDCQVVTVVDTRVGMGVGECWVICSVRLVLVFGLEGFRSCQVMCRRRTGGLCGAKRRYGRVYDLFKFTDVTVHLPFLLSVP